MIQYYTKSTSLKYSHILDKEISFFHILYAEWCIFFLRNKKTIRFTPVSHSYQPRNPESNIIAAHTHYSHPAYSVSQRWHLGRPLLLARSGPSAGHSMATSLTTMSNMSPTNMFVDHIEVEISGLYLLFYMGHFRLESI